MSAPPASPSVTRAGPSVRGTSAYVVAAVAVALSVAARIALDPWLGDALPLVTVYGAVAAAVWVGGYAPALFATLVGYLVLSYLFIEPRGQFGLTTAPELIGFAAYLATCGIIMAFGEFARRAETRAHRERELSQVTLRSIGDAVLTTDTSGAVTDMNAVAEHVTGWSLADAAGQPLEAVFRILNEHTRAPVESPVTRVLRDGGVVGLANHTILIRKDGTECPIDDSAAPIRSQRGAVSGCVLVFRDVTAQRQGEQAREQQLMTARLMAAIVESSDDAIISKSLDGTIQSWNAGAERLFGYPATEAIGRHISLVIPPDRIDEEDQIVSRLRDGMRVDHFETERVRADGRRIRVSLTVSPLRDANNRVVGASKIVRDVTRQRLAEQRERELLTEADRRKTEFMAMLAHELRNPLAPISNAAKVLRLDGADPAAFASASEMLERQVTQLSRLVDDLLDVSRITRGSLTLRRVPVELAPIVQQAVETVRALYRSMNHDLVVSLPTSPIYLDADAGRLAQVIGNLLNNACKFTDPGGRISLTAMRDGPMVTIRVRDDGIGIAAEHLARVFDMFAQVDTSLERSRDGLGIGLTLVKNLVEMHGGTVSVSSEGRSRGTEFTVRLPVLAEPPLRRSGSGGQREAPIGRRRVLVVDDSADAAESLAMLLQFSGHDTRKAHDGFEAFAAADEWRPDAVLLDIGLPGMDGYEVCRRIREQPWGRTMFLVALTGWGQEEDRLQSEAAGFDAHMLKPPDIDALLRLLSRPPSQDTTAREAVR